MNNRLQNLASQLQQFDNTILDVNINDMLYLYLNKPNKMNAINYHEFKSLRNAIKNNIYKYILVTGIGKAFSAGADLQYVQSSLKGDFQTNQFQEAYTFIYYWINLPTPTISFINGIAMGGGAALATQSTIRIATENSIFAMPESSIGLFTDIGAGYFLNKLNYNIGIYLALTGQRLKGADLVHVGLADYYLENVQYKQLQRFLNDKLNTYSLDNIHQFIYQLQVKELPKFSLINQVKLIEQIFNGDTLLEIYQNIQHCSDTQFQYQINQLLSYQCPLSLRVSFEVLKRSKYLNLKQVLINDYRIGVRIQKFKDFQEGITRIVQDKSYQPKWTYDHPLQIPQSLIDSFFEPLIEDLQLD